MGPQSDGCATAKCALHDEAIESSFRGCREAALDLAARRGVAVRTQPTRASLFGVYGAGFLQGLAVVAFPASATVLRMLHGLRDEAYGSLFLPQTALTIVGSLLGGALAGRVGLRVLLVAATAISGASQLALLSVAFIPSEYALPVLLAATGLVGLGFGLAAAPLNSLPGALFPTRRDTALLALHTAIGAGFTVGPLLVGALVGAGRWAVFPGLVAVGSLSLAAVAMAAELAPPPPTTSRRTGRTPSALVGLFALVAVLYAFAEGTFSNWAAVFLHEQRGVSESMATIALAGFWAALTIGRIASAALVARVASEKLWLALPFAMVAAFLLLPLASGAGSGIALFFFAGLACSGFFPLTVAIASKRFAGSEALVSSLLIAALMLGVGGGSFVLGAMRELGSFDFLYRLATGYPIAALLLGTIALALTARSAPHHTTRETA